jgi:hypothetical protein
MGGPHPFFTVSSRKRHLTNFETWRQIVYSEFNEILQLISATSRRQPFLPDVEILSHRVRWIDGFCGDMQKPPKLSLSKTS